MRNSKNQMEVTDLCYEVLSLLGEGGMGRVFRARDMKLKREVAIKVLPEEFAGEPERVARFQREAEALASLNHPNIAQIYGLEESGSARCIVMEMVEGETLQERIRRGAIETGEAVQIAKQIADALEAAHERGITHRDLKPANIKIEPGGAVKVLDFGLAKVREQGYDVNLSQSPTLMTAAASGVILGTAAYMAPEQAKGKPADKRGDIWAFGVVFVEMLTGAPLYTGETVPETLAAVMMREPDLKSLPPALPQPVRRLIARCLEKDPKRRLRDIGEARFILNEPDIQTAATSAEPAATAPARSNRWLIGATAALVVALAAALFFLWRAQTPGALPVVRYDVAVPEKASLDLNELPAVAISPDGSTLVFTASTDGTDRLYVRKRNDTEIRPIAGTEGGREPVFSPDGKWLAFFGGGALKKLSLDGAIVPLTKASGGARGIAWLDASTIIYSPEPASGLVQVSANGGEPKPVSTVDQSKGERTHRWAAALPGGKAVLFTLGILASPDDYDSSNIEALILATGERRVVFRGASMARYAPTGHLIFARGGTLHAIAFDPGSLTASGSPLPVVQGVAGDRTTGAAHFSAAADGTLAYVPGSPQGGLRRLVWTDRSGNLQPIDDIPVGLYFDPQVSPDGTKAAVLLVAGDSSDVWIYDFLRKTSTRLTFTGRNATPVWSADSKNIFYVAISDSSNRSTVFRKPADGAREAEEMVSIDARAYLKSVGPDGTAVFDMAGQSSSGSDVVKLKLERSAKPAPLIATPFGELGEVSPNNRFLAYQSNENGRAEIYVRDLSGGGGRWQISTAGGEEPHWSPNGRELFYRNNDLFMSVAVDTGAVFQASMPKVLFKGVYNLRSDTGLSYSVDPKSGRFLMIRLAGEETSPPVRVVLNWFQELKAAFQ